MPGFSETPIYPGKIKNDLTSIAGGSASATTIYTADAAYGGGVSAINIVNTGANTRAFRLEHVKGAATVRLSGSISLSAGASINALSPAFIAAIDPDTTVYRLGTSETLRLVTTDTNSAGLDVSCQGFTYEYPN